MADFGQGALPLTVSARLREYYIRYVRLRRMATWQAAGRRSCSGGHREDKRLVPFLLFARSEKLV